MKKGLLYFGFFLVASSSFVSVSFAKSNFNHALIMNGGGFNNAMYLGGLQAMIDAGNPPDLLIGTCGGSIAASIANRFQSSKGSSVYLKTMQSQAMFDMMKSVKETSYSGILGAIDLWNYFTSPAAQTRQHVANIFDYYLLDVPQSLMPLSLKFDQTLEEGAFPVIIQSAKLSYKPEHSGMSHKELDDPNFKLANLVYFTDRNTAKLLEGYQSEVAKQFPNSILSPLTETVVGAQVGNAVRAGISDPYMMKPYLFYQDYYVTGAADLWPYEMAESLAKNVSFFYGTKFAAQVEEEPFQSLFKYSPNERLKTVEGKKFKYSVDITDFADDASRNLNFNLNYKKMAIRFPIDMNDYDEFKLRIKLLYDYGYSRMVEAMKQSKGSLKHIRTRNTF